jgi:hypothetical protein
MMVIVPFTAVSFCIALETFALATEMEDREAFVAFPAIDSDECKRLHCDITSFKREHCFLLFNISARLFACHNNNLLPVTARGLLLSDNEFQSLDEDLKPRNFLESYFS